MIRPDIGAPGAVALLQTQRLNRAVAGVGEAERRACLAQPIMHRDREFDGNVQFPAEFTDIGDADR